MTRLTDDGYLETSDPVVAACFIGERAWSRNSPELSNPEGIHWSFEMLMAGPLTVLGTDQIVYEYPIRIPAQTVAEAWREEPATTAFMVLYTIGPVKLHDWLAKHTGGNDEIPNHQERG